MLLTGHTTGTTQADRLLRCYDAVCSARRSSGRMRSSAPAKTTVPQRRVMSDAAKQAISLRMKKYWAQRKNTQKR